jgi:hypothetical protein
MARGNQQNSGTSKWTLGGWRKPKEPEARNIVIDVAEPDFISDVTKRRILAAVIVVVLVVAVTVGVVLSKNGDESKEPMPSPTLTESPTAAPSAASIVDQFLNGLPAYSVSLAENDTASPQANALRWLRDDPQYNEYQDVHRLNQRYALAVLFYSTNGESWNNTDGWLSDDNECEWYAASWPSFDDVCGENSRLLVLSMFDNDLVGYLPTELEMLADLEKMYLTRDNLSGTIHSEL